jgi:hypothetical protein
MTEYIVIFAGNDDNSAVYKDVTQNLFGKA